MKPPERMRDDPATSAELRADLTGAYEEARRYQPRIDALRAAIAADALAAGQQGPSQELSGLGEGPPTFWRIKNWPWGWKLAVLGALGGGGAALGSGALTAASRPPPSPLATPVDPTAQPSVAAELPKPTESDARSAAVHAPLREVDWLVQMRARLQDDPAEAYRIAGELERAFPEGALREEREALALLALARMGRQEEARRQARDFLARHPESAMRGTVQGVLKQ